MYKGTIQRTPTSVDFRVTRSDGSELPMRLDLHNHSPTGFAWGYSGSGPAQLALAILADFLGNDDQAIAFHQAFKNLVVAGFPEEGGWHLSGEDIKAALEVITSGGNEEIAERNGGG